MADAKCSLHVAPKAVNVLRSDQQAPVFSWPASIRLKQGWEYDTLFRTGSRLKGRLVRLLFIQAPDGKTRFAMAVGKKMGNACVRVRGRRVLREAARRLYPWVREGYWFALMLSNKGISANARDVYRDLGTVLKRNGMMKDDWPAVWHQ